MDLLDLTTLQIIWYSIFLASMFAYAALDGFDIGVGCLQLFAKGDRDRRIFLNAIGPVWDGNALWIIITGGVLFSGFPKAFAIIFSALYIPMTLLVFGYILRAAAIEFRSRVESLRWRFFWDYVFAGASLVLALGFGTALANLIQGLPINQEGINEGQLSNFVSPYSLSVGIYTTLLLMVHGALYLNMKTEGDLQRRVQKILYPLLTLFIALWAVVTHVTLVFEPSVANVIRHAPLFFINELVAIAGLIGIVTALRNQHEGRAFLSSFLFIGSQIANFAFGTYPYLIKSTISDAFSQTLYNSSSSSYTMHILIGMAIAGVPLFLFYCIYTYRVFRGKVELDTMSY